jgi:hypothetical protein
MARFSAKPRTKAKITAIGRLWGSNLVAREADQAEVRWTRDLRALTDYGHGNEELERFKALKTEHGKLVAARPDSVATKRNVVAAKDQGFTKAEIWLNQTVCTLKQLAKKDSTFHLRVYEALPDQDGVGLPEDLDTFKLLLTDAKKLAPDNATLDKRLSEVDAILEAVRLAPANVVAAKETKVADSAELDYLDGQLIVAIRELNEAGIKAIRDGLLEARLTEYKFHHLRRTSRPAATDENSNTTPEGETEVA